MPSVLAKTKPMATATAATAATAAAEVLEVTKVKLVADVCYQTQVWPCCTLRFIRKFANFD